jgi:uncharacterized membrane protein
MTVSLVPSHWPLQPTGSRGGARWQFGQDIGPGGPGEEASGTEWLFKRNCSIGPGQLLAVYLGLCAVSLTVGLAFYFHGAPFVLGFAGVELLCVGLALLVFARHAGDRETLTLRGRTLQVNQLSANRLASTEFQAEWLTVEPAAGQGSLVELAGQGRTVRVGRFLRPELRALFARELRVALRRAAAPT